MLLLKVLGDFLPSFLPLSIPRSFGNWNTIWKLLIKVYLPKWGFDLLGEVAVLKTYFCNKTSHLSVDKLGSFKNVFVFKVDLLGELFF